MNVWGRKSPLVLGKPCFYSNSSHLGGCECGFVQFATCLFWHGLPPVVDWYLHRIERNRETDSFEESFSPWSGTQHLWSEKNYIDWQKWSMTEHLIYALEGKELFDLETWKKEKNWKKSRRVGNYHWLSCVAFCDTALPTSLTLYTDSTFPWYHHHHHHRHHHHRHNSS